MWATERKCTMRRGNLYVITGPSGAGKGTVLKKLFERRPDLKYSVSATTRDPRPGEKDGVDYYFISNEEFERKIRDGEMLEYVGYVGHYYGTPKQAVEDNLNQGHDVVLEIEVTGGKNVKHMAPDAILIFITPPSLQVLRQRLEGRGTEPQDVIDSRMEVAAKEVREYVHYDYVVVNDTVDQCAQDILVIMDATGHTTKNMSKFMEERVCKL